MARRPDPEIMKVLKEFGFGNEALWDSHGTWVIYHNVLERIAAKGKIKFRQPQILEANGKEKIAALLVFGALGDNEEWSTGEASPGNNKNAYPWAMAEKRAKDRVILKLIGLHGLAYSEEEADDFKQRVEEEADHRTPEAILNDFLDRVRTIDSREDFEQAWREEKSDLSKIQRNSPEAHAKFMRDLAVIRAERGLNGEEDPVAVRAAAAADALVKVINGSLSLADASRALMDKGLDLIEDDGAWTLKSKSALAGLKELAPSQYDRIRAAYTAYQKKDIVA